MSDIQPQRLKGINLHGRPVLNEKGTVLVENYDCCECHLILRDPRQAECGDRFCRFCLESLLAQSAICPSCKETIANKMYPDAFVRKRLAKLMVQCQCLEMIPLMDFEDHWETCPKALTACPYGCGAMIVNEEMANHKESCPQKPVVCPLCKEPVERSSQFPSPVHYQSCTAFIDPSEPVCCPECSAPLQGGLSAYSHIASSCYKSVPSCPLAIDASCTQPMDAESFKEHFVGNPSHIVAVTTGYIALQKAVSNLLQKNAADTKTQVPDAVTGGALERVEVENHALQNRVAQLESEKAAQDQKMSKLQDECNGMKSALQVMQLQMQDLLDPTAMSKSLILRRPDYEETDAKQVVPPQSGSSDQGFFGSHVYAQKQQGSSVSSVSSDRRLGSDVDSGSFSSRGGLEQKVDEMATKLAYVEKQVKHLAAQPTKVEGDSVKHELQNIHDQVHNLDNRITHCSNVMEEISLRQELQEVKTTFGVFVWKINDVQRRYREAMEGKTLSLYSPPFYTSPHGYRMCIRTYLYGDGTGKGSHISVFFVVMKSEHDQLLSWPFKQKVTISLLNQDSPAEQFSHITETFLPDPSSSSFQKPESEMNVASGFPKFVKKSVLKDARFVKQDTMYLRVRVDRTGLMSE